MKKFLTYFKKYSPFVLMFVYPVVTFYLLEWFTHNPFETMKPSTQLLNIVFFELLMVFLFALFGRLRAALMTESIFFLIFGLANYFVLSFRSVPIQPWDLFSVGTAASVASNYSYTLDKEATQALVGFLILLVLEFFCKKNFPKKKWIPRVVLGVLSFSLMFGYTKMLHNETIVQQKLRLYDKLFTPTTILYKDGTAVAFLMELQYLTVDKPAGYSAENAEETLASYEDTAVPETTPNIIVMMNEAFSDPAVLGDFTPSEDYMPFVHSLMDGAEDTISGYLHVSVKGGNTANTEFEYLTGNTMAFLPQGSIPYQQYIKGEMPSIASWLKNFGYETVAMHPYNASGWDRDTVYPALGFDTFLSLDDFEGAEIIRKYVSDQADVDKIKEVYENKEEGTPLFLFNVTMQNHSSYTEEFDNFHPDVTVEGANSTSLTNYLSLLKLSDSAVEDMISYFDAQEEPTVIVFFGDHQPTDSVINPILKQNGKSASTLTEEEEALRYKVPFFIWANYDIKEEQNVETSANYLAAQTLEAAGLPQPGYFHFLEEFSSTAPVISATHLLLSDGTFSHAEDQENLLNPYASLQYYLLFDSGK